MLIFRFLPIASLAYLCSFCAEMVSCQELSEVLERGTPVIIKHSQDIRRSYKLYNQCSGRHVQIIGKAINAKGSSNSPNVNLIFNSVHTKHNPNALNIMSQKTGRYICFNKRGKLIARFNGRKKLCLFKEDFSEFHYTVLQSVYNPSWYVGFNRKGKPLKGSLHSKSKLRSCFHFVKRDHAYGLEEPILPGPTIKDPSKLKDLLTSSRRQPPRRRKTVPRSPIR